MLLSKAFVLGPRREAWRACLGWLRPCEYWCCVRREWHLMPDGTSEHNSFGEQHLGQVSIPKSSVARCKPHSKYQQAGQILLIHRSCIDRLCQSGFSGCDQPLFGSCRYNMAPYLAVMQEERALNTVQDGLSRKTDVSPKCLISPMIQTCKLAANSGTKASDSNDAATGRRPLILKCAAGKAQKELVLTQSLRLSRGRALQYSCNIMYLGCSFPFQLNGRQRKQN